jgi:hypothetical protein
MATIIELNEQTFKSTYVANFLASYMALTYEDNCQNGHEGNPHHHQPLEDAIHLADCAWESYLKLKDGR